MMNREFYFSLRLYFLMSCLFFTCAIKAQAPVTLATLDSPTLFAVDATGNLFAQTKSGDFMDFENPPTYGIAKINPSGAVTSVFNPLLTPNEPTSMAMDPDGNFYVREGNGDVSKITPNGTITPVNIVDAMKIVCDSQGNLLVLQYYSGNYMLKKITPSGTVSTVVGPGIINTTNNLCADANGNVYVVIRNITTYVESILKISANGNYTVLAGNGILQYLPNITCDAAGNLYVVTTANFQNNSIGKLSVQGNYTTLFTNIALPSAIVVDVAGAVFLSYDQQGTILKFTETGCTPTTTTETVTACESYTWAENNTTYSTSGVYTNVVGCNTATLNLTIIAASVSQLRPMHCGQTLRWLDEKIQATPVSGATQYRFEVIRTDDALDSRIVNSNRYLFNPATQLSGGLIYGKSYYIKVKTFIGTTENPYGNTCIVTAPAEPICCTVTKLRPFQCGATLLYMTQPVEATPVYNATTYEFEVTSAAGTFVKSSPNYTFSLYYSVPGRALYGTAYSIRVRSKGAATEFTAYGDPCVVRTPIARMSDPIESDSIFNVKAFPNPFASHFSVDIESSSDALVELKVYDMLGRHLEANQATVSELSVLEVGRNYPSGVYNVVVSQGDKVKSLRMIKR